MTGQTIDQLARECAEKANLEWANDAGGPDIAHRAARLAAIAMRDRCAAIADRRAKASQAVIDHIPDENKSYSRGSLIASEQIAAAIRSQGE